MTPKNSVLGIILAILQFLSVFAKAQGQSEQLDYAQASALRAMWSISSAECNNHVKKLAGHEYQGRATGSEEFKAAARYIADQFDQIGLSRAVGDTSFLQIFDISRNVIEQGNELALEVLIKANKGYDTLWVRYDLEEDFLPAGFSSSGELLSDIVVAGYGVSSEENNWDDYAKPNVKGKVVLILGGTPPIEDAKWGMMGRLRHKVDFAAEHGASAVIEISGPYGTISSRQKIPSMLISESVANDFFKGTGWTVASLKQKIKKKQKSISVDLKHRVKIKAVNQWQPDCKTMNIVGYLAGSDSLLKDEYIVLGAHADHLGPIDRLVFWGANDNASGTATMMEIAEAFCKLENRPRRSLVFIAFTGEEMGLLGSKHYVGNPLFPLQKTKAMINLDMVGSGRDGVMIVGGETYPDFAALFERFSNQYVHVPIDRRKISQNSDHAPFYNKGVPAVFLYAMGALPTWHSTRDKPENLDAEVMESVGRLAFWVIWELANADTVEFVPFEAD